MNKRQIKITEKGKTKTKSGYDWFDKIPEILVVEVNGKKKEYPMKKCSVCGAKYEVVRGQSTKNFGVLKPTCNCAKTNFRICVGQGDFTDIIVTETDLRILGLIELHPRITIADLSIKTGYGPKAVERHLKRLADVGLVKRIEKKVIQKYITVSELRVDKDWRKRIEVV